MVLKEFLRLMMVKILHYNYPINGKEDSNENRKQISI